MAEIAGRSGVRIDTLFLDEGFAGLDQAHLDRTIDALESQVEAGRCIVLITHIGSVADRIQREIVIPARANEYREIWLVGVSMGGLGAFFHERTFPGATDGLILLAPFLGDDRKLFADIDTAGGAVPWANAQPYRNVERNRATYQRDLWLFLGRLPFRQASGQQIWVAYGDRDRLLPGIKRLSAVLAPERVFRLPGGHTWDVWKIGFDEILKRITW